MENCQACRRDAPTRYVEFYQNIGMLVMHSMRSIKGRLCKRCIKKYFLQMTGLTLVTGWWGMISLVINPFLIINNVVRYLGSLGMADGADQAFPVQQNRAGPAGSPVPGTPVVQRNPLESYRRDIIVRLRGGQTTGEIARQLAPIAGVTAVVAQQFVESIRQSGANQ